MTRGRKTLLYALREISILEEGKAKGEAKAIREMTLRFLIRRFGALPEALVQRIATSDHPISGNDYEAINGVTAPHKSPNPSPERDLLAALLSTYGMRFCAYPSQTR